MFCWKCGKELPEGARFCPGCGTQTAGERTAFTFENIHAGGMQSFAPTLSHGKIGVERLRDCKGYFWGTIACLILVLFFLGGEMFEVSFEFFTTQVERFTMFEGKDGLKTLFALVFLTSCAVLLIPLVMNKEWAGWNVYPAVIAPALSLLVLFITMGSAKKQMADSWMMEAVDAKAALTGMGWLFLLINVIAVILAVKTIRALSELQEDVAEEYAEVQDSQPPYWCAMCEQEGPYDDVCPQCGSRSKKYFKL